MKDMVQDGACPQGLGRVDLTGGKSGSQWEIQEPAQGSVRA